MLLLLLFLLSVDRDAADTVFFNRIATVIGPTPPGTGVIHDAFVRTESKSTSPQICPLNLLIPTSIITAPGLTISPDRVKRSRFPTALIIISALISFSSSPFDFEWQIVTVAPLSTSKQA